MIIYLLAATSLKLTVPINSATVLPSAESHSNVIPLPNTLSLTITGEFKMPWAGNQCSSCGLLKFDINPKRPLAKLHPFCTDIIT